MHHKSLTFLAALAAAAFASLWVRRSFLQRMVLRFLLTWCMLKRTGATSTKSNKKTNSNEKNLAGNGRTITCLSTRVLFPLEL
jgi:hypothetical protein